MGKLDMDTHTAVLPSMEEDYEQTINTLKDEIQRFWEEHRRLQTQVSSVTAENEQLGGHIAELSRSVDLPPVSQPSDLQQRLDALTKEKDSAVQLWQSSLREVERLEAALAAAAADDTEHRWRRYLEQVRAQYGRAVSALTGELSRQREAAARAAAGRAAAEEARRAAEDSCQLQRQLSARLSQQLEDAQTAAAAQADDQRQLQLLVQQLKAEAAGQLEQLERTSAEAKRLEQDLLEARQRCVELSGREAEALKKLQEGVDVVQTALMEKQEAALRAERLQGHADELEAAAGRLAEEAGVRTRQEVDAVREQCNQRLAEVAAQLQQRDTEEVETQQHIERLMREKKKIESEYDRLQAEMSRSGAGGAPPDALEELTARLSRLEDTRQTAERAAADATLQLQAARDSHQLELERQQESVADQQRRLAELTETCDDLLTQKRALTEQVATLQLEHEAAVDDATERRRSLERTVSNMELKLRQQDKQLSREIESYETDHEHTKQELRQHLVDQQNMTAKWRRELLSEARLHQQQLQQLRASERQLALKVTELEDQLRDSRQRLLEGGELAKRYRYRVRELELRVQAAEKRFLTLHSARGRTALLRPAAHLSVGQLED